jgi:tRNA (guanine-N(7)-)-methyltransferase
MSDPAVPHGASWRNFYGVWLEIGFGGGEHMVHMAATYPEVGVIGCEPFVNGVAMLLGKIRAAGVTNLAVYPGDARDALDVLPEASVARAFLNYPDPWPKRRHHRRRFVTPEHLGPLARVLEPGAEFRVATDIPDYVRQALASRCRRRASGWCSPAARPGTTGCRPATSRRRCARAARPIT